MKKTPEQPQAKQTERKQPEKEVREKRQKQENNDIVFFHPKKNIRSYAVPVAAAANGTQEGESQQSQDAGTDAPNEPPPSEGNDGGEGGDPEHPLRWPRDDREWALSTFAGRTGFGLRMTVVEVHDGLGNDFFKLNIPYNSDGLPYRGPREWLPKNEAAHDEYLVGLWRDLYQGATYGGMRAETVRRLWPECPQTEGFICPFCFAARNMHLKSFCDINRLHNHVMEAARTESTKCHINSPERIHDPSIFRRW